jgi:hypothetical protein
MLNLVDLRYGCKFLNGGTNGEKINDGGSAARTLGVSTTYVRVLADTKMAGTAGPGENPLSAVGYPWAGEWLGRSKHLPRQLACADIRYAVQCLS